MPFSVEDFLAVFSAYNAAIWPLQIVAHVGGLLAVAMLLRPSRIADVLIFAILSGMWAINGIGYHLIHFSTINPAARVFAALFVLQAVLLFAAPFIFPREQVFGAARQTLRWITGALIAYAMVFYPVIGVLAGHGYPAVPVFGVAPCPTTIFTIGVLLLGDWKRVRWLLMIPALWSAIGGSAAILLSVPQDFGLIAAGLCVLGMAVARHRVEKEKFLA